MTSRCFGWAGFQMLRFAQHDSPLSFPRILGNSDCAAVSPRPNDGYAIKSCCGGIQTGIAREQPTRLLVNATPQMLLAWACNILD